MRSILGFLTNAQCVIRSAAFIYLCWMHLNGNKNKLLTQAHRVLKMLLFILAVTTAMTLTSENVNWKIAYEKKKKCDTEK